MVFVLGCALFTADDYGEVARKLAGWLGPLAGPGRWRVPGTSALAQARRRLGPAPLAALFSALAGSLARPGTPGAAAFGRLVMAIDGTTLDLPATPANIAVFGPPPSGSRGPGGYPQARLVTLTGCGTRGLAAAAFGPRTGKGTGEQHLARQIAAGGAISAGMLILADRNFCGHSVIAALTAAGADVLIRGKTCQVLPVLQTLPDGSFLSVLADPAASRRRHHRNSLRRRRGSSLPPDRATTEGITVRVIDAVITTTSPAGPARTTRSRLITTLLDHTRAPAADIAACYAQRWEAETGFRELKTTLRGPRAVLRSRDPAGAEQEIWALLCAAQLTHTARARAAAATRTDPDQISFTTTLHTIRRAITTTRHRPATREILTRLLPPQRRSRSYPRSPRASTATRRTARASPDQPTGPVTRTITIQPPPHP